MSSKLNGKSRFDSTFSKFKAIPITSTSEVSDTSRSPSPSNRSSSKSSVAVDTASELEPDVGLSDLEKKLFEVFESGDTEAVKQFLKSNRRIDINKCDHEDLSVLHKAVINENDEMVNTLLAESTDWDIENALLYAIKEDSMQMVLKLLKYEEINGKRKKVEIVHPKNEKPDFDDPEITGDPRLLQAASSGHYEILEVLYKRLNKDLSQSDRKGLPDIHTPSCDCTTCKKSPRDLKRSHNRFQLLKGLTNPAYIAFMASETGSDPIYEVFKLISTIIQCKTEEPEFKTEYIEILQEIKKYPVDLLALCRNPEEVKIILSNKRGYTGNSDWPYPRLLMAMDLEQKDFVAHLNAQEILHEEWLGQPWDTTNNSERIVKAIVLPLLVICFPVISILLWFTLCCCRKLPGIRLLTSPRIRFWSFSFSYVFFLYVLFCVCTYEKGRAELGPPSFYMPWIIGIFTLSHVLSSVTHCLINPKQYFTSGWNVFDLVNQLLFKITIALWAYLWESRKGLHGSHKGPRHVVIERTQLEPFDITLLAEISLGFATTMAFIKPVRAFMLHPGLGPLQVAMGKLYRDLSKFILFFVVLLFCFALGTQHLYRPYSSFRDPSGKLINNDKILAQFWTSFEGYFWAMYTMTDSGSPVVEPIPILVNGSQGVPVTLHNHHFTTECVGKIIFVGFHIFTSTFLMNKMTGVMSNTYDKTQNNVNSEWKYSRSKIWIYFIQDCVVVAPFNIVPNGLSLLNIRTWLRLFRSSESTNSAGCCGLETVEGETERMVREHKYSNLMRRLLQRYFRSREFKASDEHPTKMDITTVKNNVFELKAITTLLLNKN